MLCPHGHGIACGACADRIATLESRLAEVERERDTALTRAHRIEAAAGEAADLLGIVASYVESDDDAGIGQTQWARDARRVETALRAAMGETK